MIRAIIFDFDGVLADSYSRIYALNKAAMLFVGLDLSEDEFKKCFVLNIHYGFKNLIGNEILHEKFAAFKEQHRDRFFSSLDLFPGIPDFLHKIKSKFILTIASANRDDIIAGILKKHNLDEAFKFILASREHTKENMLRKILSEIKLEPREVVMVSDTYGDIIEAKKVDLRTIGVTWGFHDPDLLSSANPDFIVKNFSKLDSALTS